MTAAEHLSAAREAFDRGDWAAAGEHFAAALALEDDPEAHDGLAHALFWAGHGPHRLDHLLAAFEGFQRRGDEARAAHLAVHLAAGYRLAGNASLARGWLSRAQRLVSGIRDVGPAHVWLEIERAKRATGAEEAERAAAAALELARRLGDTGLEAAALGQLGRALLWRGRVADGLEVLDEALATAVCADGDPLSIGDACCTTLVTCQDLADARRARDWSQAIVDFTRRRNYTPLNPWCGAIHAGFLMRTGRWAAAERELDRALAEAERLPAGDRATARVTLAGLRVRQGRLPEARALLDGCEDHPGALEPLVRLHLADGDVELAGDRVQRRLAAGLDPAALALRAEVLLARRDAPAAAEASRELDAAARARGRDDLVAEAAVLAARAARLAGGRPDVPALEAALATLADLELPLEVGGARLELARALAADHPALAIDHARTALRAFEDLGALRHADAAAALLRELGAPGRPAPRTADVLTRREQEVLELLAAGRSNAEIAEVLVISPRTAEHHVGAILRKLDLRNRAEAAVYAARAER